MTNCSHRPRMRWNGATVAIARGKRASTVCGYKSRAAHELRWTCGEKPKAKGVTRRSEPYMMRVPGESGPVTLLQSRINLGGGGERQSSRCPAPSGYHPGGVGGASRPPP